MPFAHKKWFIENDHNLTYYLFKLSMNNNIDKFNEAKIVKEKDGNILKNNCILNDIKDVCLKCDLIESCCGADRLQVIADDEEAIYLFSIFIFHRVKLYL